MSIQLLSILIFIVTVGLVISGFYFFIYAPSEKRKLRQRIELAKSELSALSSAGSESKLMRAEVLSTFPAMHRLLLSIPGISKLQLFVQQSAVNVTVGMLLTFSMLLGWFVLPLFFAIRSHRSLGRSIRTPGSGHSIYCYSHPTPTPVSLIRRTVSGRH